MKPSERAFENSDSAQVGGGCGSFISGDLCPSCGRREGGQARSPRRSVPPSSRLLGAASKHYWRSVPGGNRESDTSLREAGRPAGAVLSPSSALPDVVILLVMASPGSLCLCRFQHLLSEKWEALHETAKDVFFFLPRAVGAMAYPSLQRSLRGMERRQPCPEGLENERHMGPSVPGPSWLGSREGRGLLGLETAQGRPLGRQRRTASEKWQ